MIQLELEKPEANLQLLTALSNLIGERVRLSHKDTEEIVGRLVSVDIDKGSIWLNPDPIPPVEFGTCVVEIIDDES